MDLFQAAFSFINTVNYFYFFVFYLVSFAIWQLILRSNFVKENEYFGDYTAQNTKALIYVFFSIGLLSILYPLLTNKLQLILSFVISPGILFLFLLESSSLILLLLILFSQKVVSKLNNSQFSKELVTFLFLEFLKYLFLCLLGLLVSPICFSIIFARPF